MRCISCKSVLDDDRCEYITECNAPQICKGCSQETPRLVLMDYGHKTCGSAVVVPRGAERVALRCYRRSR